jgi:hypothetical protein
MKQMEPERKRFVPEALHRVALPAFRRSGGRAHFHDGRNVLLARLHHGRNWTADDDAVLREMCAGGAYLIDVARCLGRSQEAVRTRANILRVPVRSAPRDYGLRIRLSQPADVRPGRSPA